MTPTAWIALVALAVSAATLWWTHLAPAKVRTTVAGRVELTTDPLSTGAKTPSIIVTLLVYNSGAQPAVVHEATVAHRPLVGHGAMTLFRSRLQKLDVELTFAPKPGPPRLAPSISFVVPPKTQVVRSLLVVPIEEAKFNGFGVGPASLTLRLLVASDPEEWITAPEVVIDIDDADLAVLASIVSTPVAGGGTFVDWKTQSKPTRGIEAAVTELADELRR